MIQFHNLSFAIEDDKIFLTRFGNITGLHANFVQVQLTGENKETHMGAKLVRSSEWPRLNYVRCEQSEQELTIVQESPFVQVRTTFTVYDNTNAVRVCTTVENISSASIILEEISTLCVSGFGSTAQPENIAFTRFVQGHHAECQPKRFHLKQLGLYGGIAPSQRRLGCANVGSWSTKEELPMGMIEDLANGTVQLFQIESSASWYYEISDQDARYYLYLGGPNLSFGGWSRELQPGEGYTTPAAALAFGTDMEEAVAHMTRYRRHIAGVSQPDAALPPIFNEYMHLSWDSPTAENTAKMAPIVAKTGAEYYVIDCGWHNEEPGDKVYPYVGHWLQSDARFPEGVRKTTDMIRSLGMKPGLWIEPEIIGTRCEKMLEYYDDDCFFQRYGRRLAVHNRHFLDYRNEKVRDYMSEAIGRMVEQYGAAYIKFDYNQDCGVGTDLNAFTPGSGLEDCAEAFLSWVKEMAGKYPDVIFEGCASGGMRMDYKSLGAYSLVSTSDQTNYLLYPYIAGNILAAVLPEQAAVWSYPVTEDCQGPEVSDNRIVMNMINSFLGRMHLASHLERLNDHQMKLIQEGVAYYNTLSPMKKDAVPCFPLGFTAFGEPQVCAGLRSGNRLYLAAWNLGEPAQMRIPMKCPCTDAKIAYPNVTSVTVELSNDAIILNFPEEKSAVFLEVTEK